MKLPLPKNAKESVAIKKVAALSSIKSYYIFFWLAISYSNDDSNYLNVYTGEEISYWRGKQPIDGLNEGEHIGMLGDGRWIRKSVNQQHSFLRTVCQKEATQQQAAPTKAPTTGLTEAQTETATDISTSSIVGYLPSLVDKINEVFENNKEGAWRSRLLVQWTNMSQIFNDKYLELVEKGCPFSNSIENTVDFDTINTCRVSTTNQPFPNIIRI